MQELKQMNSGRVIAITEWLPELDVNFPTVAAGRLRRQMTMHFPPAFDNQLLGPLCLACSLWHGTYGCRPRIWLRSDHSASRITSAPPDPRPTTVLEAQALMLQERIGLSSIVIEEQLFTRKRIRQALLREREQEGGIADLMEATDTLMSDYEEVTVRLRRANFLSE